MNQQTEVNEKNLQRRIKKHIHAQLHTLECHVPAGFVDLGQRFTESLLAPFRQQDDGKQIEVKKHGGRIRIEGLPFDAIHSLLLQGVIYTEIKIRVTRARCSSEQKLQQILSALDWALWLPIQSANTWNVRVDSQSSQLYHEGKIKRIFAQSLALIQANNRNFEGSPDNLRSLDVDLILEREVLEVYVSIGGRDYWKRGHKQTFQHAAPLREDIAACLSARLAEISHEYFNLSKPTHVVNPFCGTGTLLHEAALHLSGYAHGLSNTSRWSYPTLPFFKEKSFLHQRKKHAEQVRRELSRMNTPISFIGEDLDDRLCQATAQWFDYLHSELPLFSESKAIQTDSTLTLHDDSLISHCGSLWIIANPPFGLRLSTERQGGNQALYAAFAQRIHRIAELTASRRIPVCGVVLCQSEDTWRIMLKALRRFKTRCEHLTLGGLDVRAFYFSNQSV